MNKRALPRSSSSKKYVPSYEESSDSSSEGSSDSSSEESIDTSSKENSDGSENDEVVVVKRVKSSRFTLNNIDYFLESSFSSTGEFSDKLPKPPKRIVSFSQNGKKQFMLHTVRDDSESMHDISQNTSIHSNRGGGDSNGLVIGNNNHNEDTDNDDDDKDIKENEKMKKSLCRLFGGLSCVCTFIFALVITLILILVFDDFGGNEIIEFNNNNTNHTAPPEENLIDKNQSIISENIIPLSPKLPPQYFLPETALLVFLSENTFDNGDTIYEKGTPQNRAYLWLLEEMRQRGVFRYRSLMLDTYYSSSSNSSSGSILQQQQNDPKQFLRQRQKQRNMQLASGAKEMSEEKLLQRYTLATFYYSLGGEQWLINDNWLSFKDECTWFFGNAQPCTTKSVTNSTDGSITDEGFIARINFDENNLDGIIPEEIGLLSNLIQFVVRDNPSVHGTIPTTIGQLNDMNMMTIENTLITGIIPNEIGYLKNSLTFLSLQNNMLSGPIPIEITFLTAVRQLSFPNNKLTGPLYNEFNLMSSIIFLDLSNNALSGPLFVPKEGSLRRLRGLMLSHNKLSGSIPTEIGLLRSIRTGLLLDHNELSGTIPTEMGNIILNEQLFLNNNQLTGTIPTELQSCFKNESGKLEMLRINSNSLSGNMPFEICLSIEKTMNANLATNTTSGNTIMPSIFADCNTVSCSCCNYCCNMDIIDSGQLPTIGNSMNNNKTDNDVCTCQYENANPLLCT